MNITKTLSVSTLLSILMLLFGCQSQQGGVTVTEMMRQEGQTTRLHVIQVGDMESADAIETALRAHRMAGHRADGFNAEEVAYLMEQAPSREAALVVGFREAAKNGYYIAQDGDSCTVWVRAGAQYQDNLGRGVAACLETQRL